MTQKHLLLIASSLALWLSIAKPASGFSPKNVVVIKNRCSSRRSSLPDAPPRNKLNRIRAVTPASTIICFGTDGSDNDDSDLWSSIESTVTSDPKRSAQFSIAMTTAGAALGPFLDSYHSAFGVLQYDQPFTAALWSTVDHPALTTTAWVPELFGLAGFIISWLYILLDRLPATRTEEAASQPYPPKILFGIAFFTFQYWLSGVLYQSGMDRSTILQLESLLAAIGFVALDQSFAGFLASAATAFGGPLIESGLLTLSRNGDMMGYGYHYNDLGETGFFPLWIIPVYFLGGPAVGNLARGVWNALGTHVPVEVDIKPKDEPPGCPDCLDTRTVSCPNCDGIGEYIAMGGRAVPCTSCRGRGFVICRTCFDSYDQDPNDIEGIRDLLSRMPD